MIKPEETVAILALVRRMRVGVKYKIRLSPHLTDPTSNEYKKCVAACSEMIRVMKAFLEAEGDPVEVIYTEDGFMFLPLET